MKEGIWYDFDPDNRKDEPTHAIFCIRCKKKFRFGKPSDSIVRVVLHPEPMVPWLRLYTKKEWEEWRDAGGDHHNVPWHNLGPECMNKLVEMEKV